MMTGRILSDVERLQVARLRALLKADFERTQVDWMVIAELEAVREFLRESGLSHLVVKLERDEKEREEKLSS